MISMHPQLGASQSIKGRSSRFWNIAETSRASRSQGLRRPLYTSLSSSQARHVGLWSARAAVLVGSLASKRNEGTIGQGREPVLNQSNVGALEASADIHYQHQKQLHCRRQLHIKKIVILMRWPSLTLQVLQFQG